MNSYMFIDLDDCIVESSALIQAAFDMKTPFKNHRLELLEYTVAICKQAYESNCLEVSRAMAFNEKPRLIGNVRVGSNDIMKTSSGNSQIDALEKEKRRHIRWYKRPLQISLEAFEAAEREKEMFLEERDHFLEMDNQNNKEEAIVDYDSIYSIKHLIPGVIQMISEIIDSREYHGCFCLSHHNGGREEIRKRNFINEITNNRLGFLGLRFHSEPYKKDFRRKRSSKALYVMEKFGLTDLTGCVLIDDSTANLDEWDKYGGWSILYRPISEDEEFEGSLTPHNRNYPRITKMDKEELDKALQFHKGKTYTNRYSDYFS